MVVVNSGSALNLSEVSHMLMLFYMLGIWAVGGNAIAEIIFGDSNPSGKLPFTIPKSSDQLPDYENYSMKNRTYRYMQNTPMYPLVLALVILNLNILIYS